MSRNDFIANKKKVAELPSVAILLLKKGVLKNIYILKWN